MGNAVLILESYFFLAVPVQCQGVTFLCCLEVCASIVAPVDTKASSHHLSTVDIRSFILQCNHKNKVPVLAQTT